MNMTIRSAVGLALCAALGSNAYAINKSDYANMSKVYFGGATATDNVLEAAFISSVSGTSICDTTLGNIDIYRLASPANRVITCFVSNDNSPGHGFATRAAGGTKIAFHKESAGGSSNGVTPLIQVSGGLGHSLRWLDLSALTSDCTVTAVAATATTAAYTNHASCSASLTTLDTAGSSTYDAHGGISDVEPALSSPAPTSAEIARLNVKPGVGIVMGVPVTTKLYRALQEAQFTSNSGCWASDTTACVPSLTRSQIAALYNQGITDWNDFKDINGASLVSLSSVAPTDEFVRICRRVATSGTQASFETYFLNQRCVDGVQGFAGPDDASTVTDTVYSPNDFINGSLVNAGPGSGDVRTCLASANTNGFWGIGVLSTEVTDANYNSGNAGFRFIAIDGAKPNLADVANGDYSFFVENTINRIKTGSGALADGDTRREVIEVLEERLGNTGALATLNAGFDGRPWGNGGVLALSSVATTNTAPYSDAELAASPVNTQSRAGNNCAPPFMSKAQPTP